MTESEQLKFVYKIFDFPPKTEREADRSIVWQLLLCGCPPRYILSAFEALCKKSHTDDAYEEDEE